MLVYLFNYLFVWPNFNNRFSRSFLHTYPNFPEKVLAPKKRRFN